MLSLRSSAFVLLLLTSSFNLFSESRSTSPHPESEYNKTILRRAPEQPVSATVLTTDPSATEQLKPLARLKQYCTMTTPNPILSSIMLVGTIIALQQENFFAR